MVSRRSSALLAGVVAIVVLARAAEGQPAMADAEREYRLGYRALRAGDCGLALVHYRRSLAIVTRPRTLFNIATCQEQLGQTAEAVVSYRAFLDRAEPRDAAIVAEARARLDALRGRVEIVTSPPGAAVLVDGATSSRGATPLVLMLDPGRHDITVVAADGATVQRTLEVTPDGVTTLHVELPPPERIGIPVEPRDALIERGGAVGADAMAGRAHEPSARLRPASAPASLVLAGTPGATVTVDGRAAGIVPVASGTLVLGAVSPGVHELRVTRAGFVPWRASLALAADESVTVDLHLPAAPRQALPRALRGLGIAGLAAGGVLGVLALRDVTGASPAEHDRGKTRALVADGLVVVSTAALVAAWRLARPTPPTMTIRRRLRGAP
jgi:hypothetical protein